MLDKHKLLKVLPGIILGVFLALSYFHVLPGFPTSATCLLIVFVFAGYLVVPFFNKAEQSVKNYLTETKNARYFLVVFLLGGGLSLYGYLEGFTHPFRSDSYLLLNLFNHLPLSLDNLYSIVTLQVSGHKRFDTLGFLFSYLQYKVLGCNYVLHHLFQFFMHLGNVVLLYIFAVHVLQNRVLACISSILFLSFYSHFDLVNWTCQSWIPFSSILVLSGLILIPRYISTKRRKYVYLSAVALLSSLFFYQANIIFPLSAVFLFLILLRQRNEISLFQEKGLVIFIIIVATGYVLYGMYVYLSAQTGTSTVTLSQATGLGNMLKACEITGWTIVDPVVLKNFGFPSELEIRDIVYMRPVTFQPTLPRFVLALISLFVFAASIRIDRRVWRLLALFFLILASYIFLITTGRILSAPEGYVASQARYFYVPNMFFAIFIVLLVKEKAASFARSSYPLFVSLTCIIILNVFSVRSHTATISEKLLPLTTYIGDVKAFYSEHKQEEDFKLFVDFPISQENGTFNLGADIALDVYFYNAKILTKNIYQAKYVYSKDRTFHKNPLFNLPSPQNPDFTIEFVYTQVVPVPEEFAVIGRLDGEWCFKFTPKNRAVFQAKMFKKKRAFFKVFDTGVILPIDYPVHFVVQKQESILYILVDGEIFCLEDIKGYKLDIDKGISYIMGTPYYGEKLFALPGRLFASIGKPHYDLRGKKLGDICPEVPVLERKANLNIDPEEKKKRELLNRPHWVMVDFGQEPKVVNTVKARPRTANASQFWKVATLKGSNDGVTFKDIADLNVPHVPPENEWLIWTFKNDCPYRFYMILISSGHKDGRFFSCSELKFVAHTQNLIGVPEYTSSPYLGGWSPANLTDENIDTFWHATYYTQHVTANKED